MWTQGTCRSRSNTTSGFVDFYSKGRYVYVSLEFRDELEVYISALITQKSVHIPSVCSHSSHFGSLSSEELILH